MYKRQVPIPNAEAELKKFYHKKGYDRGITLYNALDNNYQPWGKINMSWPNSDTFGPTYDVLPVSYTHLDVYKRQGLGKTLQHLQS